MKFRDMTKKEISDFIAEPGRTAVLNIGDLLTCPVWYYPHGEWVSFMTSSESRKVTLLAKPTRDLSLCVQDYSEERVCYVTLRGTAELYFMTSAPADLPWRIASRYLEGNSLDAFLDHAVDDMAVRVRPYKVVGKILEV